MLEVGCRWPKATFLAMHTGLLRIRRRGGRKQARRSPEVITLTFIQVIEVSTTRPAEVQSLIEEWGTQTAGRRTARRGTFAVDRDRPSICVQIVEFPSYEAAMANSALPETAAFAERLAQLCDAPMVFRNLDVQSVLEM